VSSPLKQLRELRGKTGAAAVVALGFAAVWVVLLAIVGAIAISGERDKSTGVAAGGRPRTGTGAAPTAPGQSVPGDTTPDGQPLAPGAADGTAGGAATGPDASGGGGGGPAGATTPSPTGGDTTGVTDSEIKIGIHAPMTFSGVPLNLAEDPIKGVHTYTDYINANGGINGRKIVLDIQDDRYDSDGARNSAQLLINDHQNFMVSGTLGIDQVAIVATEAANRSVPYTAAGGVEARPIPGMYQLAGSYTTHAQKLAQFMASDAKLKDLKKVGVIAVDSEFVKPLVQEFKDALAPYGFEVVAEVYNQKPVDNPPYDNYIATLKQGGTQVLVPLTDPLTTQQIVQRCAGGLGCSWTYTFSNFAHDSDTALALFVPTWAAQNVRGLSSGCYYMAPEVDGDNCAQMKVAREQWIAAHGESDWESNGSGGSSGYQIVSFLKGALQGAGADLTRERFREAIAAFDNYSDLVSGPITFVGSSNTMHGVERMTVLEAQTNHKYKMISPGFVDGF